MTAMSRAGTPDLVRDSILRTHFNGPSTIHSYVEYDNNRQRTVLEEYWERERVIARGGFGKVCLERCTEGRSFRALRAVKKIYKSPQGKITEYYRELEILAKFSNPIYKDHFVRSFGWYEQGDKICIAMEYYPLGDLHQYLQEVPQLPGEEVQQLAQQILEGLCKMHDHGIAHRDLKPANILVQSKPPIWWVKLTDFGISKRTSDGYGQSTMKGTEPFMPPELIFRHIEDLASYDYQSADLWAVGEITFQMLTGQHVFQHQGALEKYVFRRQSSDIDRAGTVAGEIGMDFIKQLMAINPRLRMRSTMALSHPWIQSGRSEPMENVSKSTEPRVEMPLFEYGHLSSGARQIQRTTPEASRNWSTVSNDIEGNPQIKLKAKSILDQLNSEARAYIGKEIQFNFSGSNGNSRTPLPASRTDADAGTSTRNITASGTKDTIRAMRSVSNVTLPYSTPMYGSEARRQPDRPPATASSKVPESSALDEPWHLMQTITVAPTKTSAVAFSLDSKKLAIGCYDGTIKVLDVHLGMIVRSIKTALSDRIPSICWFTNDIKQLALVNGDFDRVIVWDDEVRKVKSDSHVVPGSLSLPLTSPLVVLEKKTPLGAEDGTKLVVISFLGSKLEGWIIKHQRSVYRYIVSPDGRSIASLSKDGYIRVWDIKSKQILYKWSHEHLTVALSRQALALSPQGGRQLASTYPNPGLTVWDNISGNILWRYPYGLHLLDGYSPDGTMLVSRENDTVKLWDSASGAILHALNEHSRVSTYHSVFSPDSKLLALLHRGYIDLWDTSTGTMLQKFVERRYDGVGTSMVFSWDSKLLVIAQGTFVRCWAVRE